MLEAFGRSAYVKRFLDGFVPLEFPDILEAPRTASGLGMERSTLKLEVMSLDSWRQGPASVRYGARSGGGGRIYGSGAYGVNSYTKPALMLLTLENHLGWTVLQNVLSTYFERWKFRHPRPEDFFAVAEEVSGEDLSWFWEQTYYSSNVFDYSADGVRERASDQQVLVRRWGEGIFPVEIEVVFESGNKLIEHWDGRARWKGFVYPKEDPVVAVRVDPQRKLALDVDVVNNTWIKKAPDRFAGWKWGLKWMTWLQNMLQQFAFFS